MDYEFILQHHGYQAAEDALLSEDEILRYEDEACLHEDDEQN